MSNINYKEVNEVIVSLLKDKDRLGMTYSDIAEKIKETYGLDYSISKYKNQMSRMKKSQPLNDAEFKEEIDKINYSDRLTQTNANLRMIAREETIKEIAANAAKQISTHVLLKDPLKTFVSSSEDLVGILQISDWHYGLDVFNYWNNYNCDIAKRRVSELLDRVIHICEDKSIKKVYVVNSGDLIAGRIHLKIRLNSRVDVITQIIEVSEILAEFLNSLSQHVSIEYYDTLDNHSRLEPNLKDSLDLESLTRITHWFLKERLKDNYNIRIVENEFSDDIATLNVFSHKIICVHGDKDSPEKLITNLSMMTEQHYDLVLSAHYHHFSANEQNFTLLISNGSLLGTDDYAEKLRLSSPASQNFIVSSEDNVCECLYRIVVE